MPGKKIKILLAGLLLAALAVFSAWYFSVRQPGAEKKAAQTRSPETARAEVPLGNGVFLSFVRLPGGRFTMGASPGDTEAKKDELPAHQVTLSPFFMGSTEVTVAQFSEFVKRSGYKPGGGKVRSMAVGLEGLLVEDPGGHSFVDPGFAQEPGCPVVFVTHDDAEAFCKWLSEKTGGVFSLPTEAQWEYAARSGTQTTWWWGNDPAGGRGLINGPDETAKNTYPRFGEIFKFADGFVRTAPVASFSPDNFGLFDMSGNVAEWCADRFDAGYYAKSPENDPEGPATGSFCVIRGGSWAGRPSFTRSSARAGNFASMRSNDTGFRVACSKLPPGAVPKSPAAGPAQPSAGNPEGAP